MTDTDKTKILFCNIGWMEKYEGEGDDDKRPEGGGAFNQENVGFEACNFSEIEGHVYGYVENGGSIALERITAREKEDEFVSGVTVVWTARHPNGGVFIVGWYKNATVYQELQTSPIQWRKDKETAYYNISASVNDATLLPIENRDFPIPRKQEGFMGQRNIWYADRDDMPEVKNLVFKVIEFVNERSVSQVPGSGMSRSEGDPQPVSYISKKRSAKLVNAKKDEAFKDFDNLCCAVCNFNFAAAYGEWGKKCCEAHHLNQLSKSDGEVETTLEDLAIICSNCHRIIHHKDPMLTIDELKEEIAKVSGT